MWKIGKNEENEREESDNVTSRNKSNVGKKKKGTLATIGTLFAALLLFFITGNTSELTGLLSDAPAPDEGDVIDAISNAEDDDSEAADEMLKLSYIDVGQGDSELIRFPNGKLVLIDTGPSEGREQLKAYLSSEGVSEIEYLIVTHPHSDHMGNAKWVIQNYDINNVILPDVSASGYAYEKLLKAIENEKNERGCKLLRANPGDMYPIGGGTMTIYAPLYIDHDNFNDCSVVLRIVYGDFSALFMGDAEKTSEQRIMKKGYPLGSDVLKVGHHGSVSSTGDSFLDAVSPSVAVISCAKNNDYGHPHVETRAALEKRGIQYYVTKDCGTVCIYSDGKDGVYIKTEKSTS